MTKTVLPNHPLRFELTNELHARPFPELGAPCRAAFLALKAPENAAERDRGLDREHLIALLDRFGAPHPAPGANHYSGPIGRGFLKWEQHTEFVTYTIFADGVAEVPFNGTAFSLFPQDWLEQAPGVVLTSALVRVETYADENAINDFIKNKFKNWFVPESLAVSHVVDNEAVVAADFRIASDGHVRFAVLAKEGISQRRLGRVVQRLLEIETYKTASMLTLPIARNVAQRVAHLDKELVQIVQEISETKGDSASHLRALLKISAEIELLSANSAFRFGAAEAYAAIVNHRIMVLREVRILGRQLFSEFMMRRYDPAMRTCRSAQERLQDLAQRAERASNLLRTQVDVSISEQNNELLNQMNRRAELQLQLQHTVEGLSVVAISYYAVSLGGYLLSPVGYMLGIDKVTLMAGLAVPVIGAVLWGTRRIRKTLSH